MITFAVEPWHLVKAEIRPCWEEHYYEVADATDHERMPLDPDWAKYDQAAADHRLQILVGRQRGRIVAYVFFFVDTHLHYKSTLCAFMDLYWVKPNVRGHWVGVWMFRAFEAECRRRGVKKMFGGTKMWLDVSPIFSRLGWRHVEQNHTKWIDL